VTADNNEEKLRDYLRRVTVELHKTKARLQEQEEQDREPIAIVGLACRLPGGVATPAELWQLLAEGKSAIVDFPRNRGWDVDNLYDPDPERMGTSTVRRGGFLDDISGFDADFFGISPREALATDPQQRVMLEVAWEALERARLDPTRLEGSQTGVFMGLWQSGYATSTGRIPREIEGYMSIGASSSVASGRIAYTLGLHGPTLSVDTACSSSLVALHLAARALRSGECSLALAGGVTFMATPSLFVEFSRQRNLAPDGACKPFSARADGTSWSEGAVALVLERESDAKRNGRRIFGLIRGSAVNQDGRSQGLTAPNGPAQREVIKRALLSARLAPSDIAVVETHGTGTTLGDPIEAQALIGVYGTRPAGDPLWLGALKSNIGHTQAAAGIAGVIKLLLAFEHDVLPKNLYAEDPTPHVDWGMGSVRLARDPVAWPRGDKPRRGAVSSFGFSGTNAHIIVEEPPAREPRELGSSTKLAHGILPFVLSAKSERALTGQAERLAAALPDAALDDVARALVFQRAEFDVRALVLARDHAELARELGALASVPAGALPPRRARRAAFLFTGQGSQRAAMGRTLYQRVPAFRAALDEVFAGFAGKLPEPLETVLFAAPGSPRAALLDQTQYTQAALFALEVALFRTLAGWGVKASFLLGHSVGEIAAAHVAAVLSLSDACTLVAARGRLMQALPGGGKMAAIAAKEEELAEHLLAHGGRLSLAAVNGPHALVVSGDGLAVEAVVSAFRAQGRDVRELVVSHAFHSAHMDAMLEPFRKELEALQFAPAQLPIVSNVTGRIAPPELHASPDYWVEQVRGAVRFHEGLSALDAAGANAYLELGPRGILSALVDGTLGERATSVHALMRSEGDEVENVLRALGDFYVRGGEVGWRQFFGDAGEGVDLPTYAFDRARYWLETQPNLDVGAAGLDAIDHPMLGACTLLAEGEALVFSGRLRTDQVPWLPEHAVYGRAILPGTAFAELATAAGRQVGLERIEELVLEAPLALSGEPVQLQVQLSPADDRGARSVTIHARHESSDPFTPWRCHARGTLVEASFGSEAALATWPPLGAEPVGVEGLYERLAEAGLQYGPTFRGLAAVYRAHDGDYAEVALPDAARQQAASFGLHPALLDASLHALAVLARDGEVRLPFAWRGLTIRSRGASALRVRIGRDETGQRVRLSLWDETGLPIGEVEELALRPATGARESQDLYRMSWLGRDLPAHGASFAVLGAVAPRVAEARFPDVGALRSALASGVSPSLLVVDAASLVEAGESSAQNAEKGTVALLRTLRELLAEPGLSDSKVLVLTERATALEPREAPALDQAALVGLVRSVQTEHSERALAWLDWDGSAASEDVLARALASEEPQGALRQGLFLVPRLVRTEPEALAALPEGHNYALLVDKPGTIDGIAFKPVEPRVLAPRDVRVAVRATGLNFRDVLASLGMYPGDPGPLGYEGSGVVVEVGSEVATLSVGDRVMGLFTRGFSPNVIEDERRLVRIPRGVDLRDAAGIPLVFLTAFYALCDLAQVRAGEKLLVHAAAGGVGMAAVQLAQHLGLQVFGTSSEGKRAHLRALGLDDDHLGSSRDLSFEPAIRAVSGGVDVVLDSLAGEFVDASLRTLKPGGRFIEMGKADVRDAGQVAEAYGGVRYRAFDLSEAGIDRTQQMLQALVALFEEGALRPLPTTRWDLREAREAFHAMAQAKHVGKMVLTMPQPLAGVLSEGCVLISGGAGALAGVLARHLFDRHAVRHFVLCSRRGAGDALKTELEERGAQVMLAACDVSDRAALSDLIAKITGERPLTAVFHAAGVLDDAMLAQQDAARVARVFAPKVHGAWNLHTLTRDLDLAEFVMFSSVSGVLGGAGQSNYAAANTFLDGLASARRAQGSSGRSLAFGLWRESGGMGGSLSEADHARLAASGLRALPSDEGLSLLDAALRRREPLLVPVGFTRALSDGTLANTPVLLSQLVRSRATRASGGAGASFGNQLAALPAEARVRFVFEHVRTVVCAVLRSDAAQIVADRPLKDLGLDSLMAVELRNRLATLTGLRLPSTLLFDHPTPQALADVLLKKLVREPAVKAAPVQAAVRHEARSEDEPIAIVSMSCRYADGVDSPEALWQLLVDGRDAMSDPPVDRGWDLASLYDPDPDSRGTTTVLRAAYLHEAAQFDGAFFAISPRESLAMDPQQRLLLRSAWEVFERAGIEPASLRGKATGVYVGLWANGYGAEGARIAPPELEGFMAIGTAASVASGRIAYCLGLEGPALTVDTACSSSLVAIHLACQALRHGDCDFALAGGVTVMATPATFIEFSRQRNLAQDGRCKAFSADADGTAWGEGVGMIALERLSDARKNGHPVLAIVRGSAINQDGRSQGLTAPNGPAQEAVIAQALAHARLDPRDVDVVEAHGTGTVLGDPIEAHAVLAAYGQDRPVDAPLWLGSLKSNLGHTQAAAGVGGVIKMVLSMQHGALPKTLYADTPTPHVDWTQGHVELLHELKPWPRREDRLRRAGVSSFGMSGTNAHVIVEEAPPPSSAEVAVAATDSLQLFVLSGRSEAALAEQAARLRAHMAARPELALVDVAWSLATSRSRFAERALVVAADRAALLEGLSDIAQRNAPKHAIVARADVEGKLVFVCPGQGGQWLGMGRALFEQSAVFAARMDECDAALFPHTGWRLREMLARDEEELLENLDTLQPLLFSIMVSVAALWRAHGVEPDAVVGHSQGEVAAACIAGALSLEDAARIVAVRSEALERLHGLGSMAVVESSVEGLRPFLAKYGSALSVGAINSARSTIVSGAPDALTALTAELGAAEIVARRMRVHTAGHCAQVDGLREEMLSRLAGITPSASRIPIYSTVTGAPIDATHLDNHYWFRNARETVLFAAAMERLIEDGFGFFVELSPHMVLRQAIEQAGTAAGKRVAYSGTLRRDDGGLDRFLLSVAQLHGRGYPVDLGRIAAGGKLVELPTYAFQEEGYWLTGGKGAGDAAALGLTVSDHPLIAVSSVLADGGGALLSARLTRSSHPLLYEYTRSGNAVVPEGALVEMALVAGRSLALESLSDLTIEAPMPLLERGATLVQINVAASDGEGRRPLQIFAREEGDDGAPWTRHAFGVLAASGAPERREEPELGQPSDVDPDSFFAASESRGVHHGSAYRCIDRAAYLGEELELKLTLPEGLAEEAERTVFHPALLAAVCAAVQIDAEPDSGVVRWQGVHVVSPGASEVVVRVRFDTARAAASLLVRDTTGALVADVARVEFGPLVTQHASRSARRTDAMHAIEWLTVPRPDVAPFDAVIGALSEAPELSSHGDFEALRSAVERTGSVPRRVLFSCLGTPADDPASVRANVVRALGTLQAWLGDERFVESELVFLTRGAVAVRDDDRIDLAHSGVWGLVRTAQSEHPDAAIRIVDLDPAASESEPWAAAVSSDEPQLAVRGDGLVVPRLAKRRVAPGAPAVEAVAGTVLVTGGTGALGAAIARHLVVTHGARRLLLCSRSGAADALRDELVALGAEVRIAACDVSRRDEVAALLSSVPVEHPLSMIVHTAGAIEDGVIKVQDANSVGRVFAPKVDGALHLDELSRALPVQAFVLFSSFAGIVGSRGQANYSAANSVLDALAQARRAAGFPAQSLAWGFWAEKGALSAHLSESDIARLARGGVQPLQLDEGLALFDAALACGSVQLVPARLQARLLRSGGETAPAVLRTVSKNKRAERSGSLKSRLQALSEAERHGVLVDAVRGAVAAILGGKPSDIDPQRTLTELGMDSLMAVELRNQLAALTGLRMPGTLVFDYRTPDALAQYILPRFQAASTSASSAAKVNGTPLLAMVAQAVVAGEQVMAWQMIDFATRRRAEYEPSGRGVKAHVHRIANGSRGPHLVCLPSPVPPHGPQQYLRLANALNGRHDVSVLSFPGYAPSEPLFPTLDGLLACLAETALECAGGRPFALLGYSGGGYLAYELGHYLERNGLLSQGVVLLDTPIQNKEIADIDPATGLPNWRAYFNLPSGRSVGGRMMADGTVLGGIGEPTCDEELSAMARYLGALIGRFVEGRWTPYTGKTRTLMVRCTDDWNVPGTVVDIPPSERWHASHDQVVVPGDHFTFMADHAQITAAAVSGWLSDMNEISGVQVAEARQGSAHEASASL
jgi:acyl transferase domain-containing protein/NADPH:quinone reductase-like Zn-dependent oxidoreductase/acyl carrier protein/thioesterase domain-containing protein